MEGKEERTKSGGVGARKGRQALGVRHIGSPEQLGWNMPSTAFWVNLRCVGKDHLWN